MTAQAFAWPELVLGVFLAAPLVALVFALCFIGQDNAPAYLDPEDPAFAMELWRMLVVAGYTDEQAAKIVDAPEDVGNWMTLGEYR